MIFLRDEPAFYAKLKAMKPNAGDVLELRSEDGAGATVHLQGAQVLSWLPACGKQQLYLSKASSFEPGVAIRGGVPVVFPQFSGRGPLQKHGFARNLRWTLLEKRTGRAKLRLTDTTESRAMWPHPFELRLDITVEEQVLEMWLHVRNTGEAPFSFMAALHTYLAVEDCLTLGVEGLSGCSFSDNVTSLTHEDREPKITFGTDIDRLYPGAHERMVKVAGHEVSQEGFADTVVWNPGPVTGSKIADLDQPDGWRKFVCVEAAQVLTPVTLVPGQTWKGGQQLVAK
jgi:glucose-6-phosphate 1-epimerase